MSTRLSRRRFMAGSVAVLASASLARADDPYVEFNDGTKASLGDDPIVAEEQYFDANLLPPPESEVDFPVEPVNPRLIKKKYRRQMVDFDGTKTPARWSSTPRTAFSITCWPMVRPSVTASVLAGPVLPGPAVRKSA